jgi:hypothetical protein
MKDREINQKNFEITSKLESVKEFILNKQLKKANILLHEVLQKDKNNKDAQELFSQLEDGRRISNFRKSLIVIFLITAVSISILGWVEVHSTKVSIEIIVNQASFTLSNDWNIYSIDAKSIGISHMDDLCLSPQRVAMATDFESKTDQPIKWITKDIDDDFHIKGNNEYWNVKLESPYLNLSSLFIGFGSNVKMTMNEKDENKIILSISNGKVSGTIETDTTFTLKGNRIQTIKHFNEKHSPSKLLKIFTQNREIDFQDLNHSISIVLEFPQDQLKMELYTFGKSIAINEIDFIYNEAGEKESTILKDGKITFPELDAKEFNLKAGDFLFVNDLENFQIKRLFVNDHIKLSLFGDVHDLKSGAILYSRMPTYLEWLHNNYSIAIFIGTLIPVFSTLLAIFYRLRIITKL